MLERASMPGQGGVQIYRKFGGSNNKKSSNPNCFGRQNLRIIQRCAFSSEQREIENAKNRPVFSFTHVALESLTSMDVPEDSRILSSENKDESMTRFTAAVYALIVLLGMLAGLGPLAIDMYLPAFTAMAGEFGTNEAGIEKTLAVYFIGIAVGQLFYGPATDRWGRKLPLYVGLVTFVVASVGCAMARSVDQLILMRLLQALGGCAEMVVARAIVRDQFHARDAARVFSSLMLVMGLAPILAPLIGGQILLHWGWRGIFWVLGGIGAACLLSVFLFLRETHPPEKRQRQSPWEVAVSYGQLLRHGEFMKYALAGAFASAGMFAYISGSPFVYMSLFGCSPQQFAMFFGINAAGLIACSQINGFLVRRGGDPATLLRGALLMGFVAALVLFALANSHTGGFAGVAIPIFFFISSLGFIYPNTTALAMAPHGKMAGNASAVLGCLQFLVSGLGGFLVSSLHNETVFPMTAVLALCSLLTIVNITLPRRRMARQA